MIDLPKIIAIVGPTTSGKTALALKLAKKFNGEIVSADSQQVYRGMDIGTAKPPISYVRRSRASTKSSVPSNDGTHIYSHGIRHYLIDIKNPNQSFTLAEYKKEAIRSIKKILKKGKLPFLVGGTGLYISTIVSNFEIPQVKPNRQLRAKLQRQIKKHGLYYLYGKLVSLDPEAAYIVDPKNPRRIIRALEIAMATKRPFSKQRKTGPPIFDCLLIGVDLPKEELKAKIERRIEMMIKKGLVQEVRGLVKKYGFRHSPFDAIGYREIMEHLKGKAALQAAISQINKNTWHFAKRQMTWFKRLPVIWIKNQAQAEQEIKNFLAAIFLSWNR